MEVAGLVLGALPVVIQALKCYKTSKSALDVVVSRRRHISKLLRSLNELKCILDADIISVLRAACVFGGHHQRSDIAMLLQNPRATESLSSYLGVDGFGTFQNVIYDAQEVIEEVGRNVTGLLPADILNCDHQEVLWALSSRNTQEVKIQFADGIKLVWRKADLEKSIQALDSSIRRFHMLVSAATRVPRVDQDQGRSGKLAKSLVRVREVAARLYDAFVLGWSFGCHSTHEAKLYLEHRMASTRGPPSGFKVAFISSSAKEGAFSWHESVVEVTDEKQDAYEARSPGGTSSTLRVAFATTPPPTPPSQAPRLVEDRSICAAIHTAEQEQKSVKFFLGASDKRLRYCCYRHSETHTRRSQSVSLKDFLVASASAARSQRASIKARVHLALVIASATLQLSSTQWYGMVWSKESICFPAPGFPPEGTSSADATHILGDVDLMRPLTSMVHDVTAIGGSAGTSKPQPKAALLELGIMFLEIWTEQTLEQYCEARGQSIDGTDYYMRSSIAHRWLEDAEGALLPFQVDVVSRCTKCFFEGVPLQPSWDDDKFVNSFLHRRAFNTAEEPTELAEALLSRRIISIPALDAKTQLKRLSRGNATAFAIIGSKLLHSPLVGKYPLTTAVHCTDAPPLANSTAADFCAAVRKAKSASVCFAGTFGKQLPVPCYDYRLRPKWRAEGPFISNSIGSTPHKNVHWAVQQRVR